MTFTLPRSPNSGPDIQLLDYLAVMSPPPLRLPPGFVSIRQLSDGDQGEVHHARGPQGEVALRVIRPGPRDPRRTELEVLAALHHPGLASLVDFGHVEGSGETWIARTWIEGKELGAWSQERDESEVGRLIADLTLPLQYLHERGFVHGDLKPQNILVDGAGVPHLTDFGLSRRGGSIKAAGGSLFFSAPEQIAGDSLDAAADLFSLGVTLHSLLQKPEVSAAEFYSRFPREDYFSATQTSLADLPEWSREIVAALLERSPEQRPRSAYAVGAALRARLGLAPSKQSSDLRQREIRWSPLAGRESWLEETGLEGQASGCCELPLGESPASFARALRLWLAQRDRPSRIVQPEDQQTVHEFEESLQPKLGLAAEGLMILPLEGRDREAELFLEVLQRCSRKQRTLDPPRELRWILVTCAACAAQESSFASWKVPALELATLTNLLHEELGGDVFEIAQELNRSSGGACETARRRLQTGFRRGDFVDGPEGPQLRQGASPATWGEALELSELNPPPASLELDFLAALEVCERSASLEELSKLMDVEASRCLRGLEYALSQGLVLRNSDGAQMRVVPLQPIIDLLRESVPTERWQSLYRSRAKTLKRGRASSSRVLLAQYAGAPNATHFRAALAELRRLIEAWKPEQALEFAEALKSHASRFQQEHLPRARAEVAVAWARLGQLDTAGAMLAELESEGIPSPETLATIERSRGVIAHERHDFRAASEHLKRARELHPVDDGESLFRQAQLAFDRRAEEELEGLYGLAEQEAALQPSPFHWNTRALMGLSLCRRGRSREGLQLLNAQLEEALTKGDEAREAKTRLNLATVIRRTSEPEQAITHLRRAVEIHRKENHLPGLAQARAMLGGTLRGQGLLRQAQEELRSAYELRERLGDESGAVAARGMLGFVLADGGCLRPALDELTASAKFLRKARRSADAGLLEARAIELEARLTPSPPKSIAAADPAPDPRVLTSFARAQALWGNVEQAKQLGQRALELAKKLELGPACVEAEFLLRAFDGAASNPQNSAGASPRVDAELRTWSAITLSPDQFVPFQALELARAISAQGFMDLASRLAIAVHARSESHADRELAMELARKWLESVERGLTPAELDRSRTTLLGLPDPRPQEINNFNNASTNNGVIDLDIIALLDINHRLVEQENLPSLLTEIVESALAVTRGERGFLVLEREGELEFDTARHSCRGDIPDPELEVSSSVLTRVFNSGKTVRLSNAGEDPALAGAPSVEQLDLRSILVTPFTVDGGLRGAIYVDHRLRMGAFSDRAEQLLELLATQAALAIRQVRRIEEIRTLNAELKDRVKDRERQLARAREALAEVGERLPVPELIGTSKVMRDVCANILRAAPADLPVLVSGESGTGKELAAKALHGNSKRTDGPFIAENCAALPASLIESELFGYRKGAFTGADRDRAGIFERADGGTLFLDEIGELPLELQAKLLRVLETGELRRVGDTKLIRTDFRLIVATNRDLQAEVLAGRFRADLMYRLDGLQIEMPSLREHETDIPELVRHFLDREARASGKHRDVCPATMAALCRRDWPGNVRELVNEVKRLCVLNEGDLNDPSLIRPPAMRAAGHAIDLQSADGIVPFAQLERLAIENALRATGNDKRKAAELLGISRAKLYQRLKEWSHTEREGKEGP